VAALQLVEQGSIALDDHAEKYVPEIGKIHILTGFDEGILNI
jgi:CubicO group peptidase (beta-lactamase class C family)